MYVHQVLQCKMPEGSLVRKTQKRVNNVLPLRDNALFKDPPAKEDCPICFLPMPGYLICCISLPPATISSVPIYTVANEELLISLWKNIIHVAEKAFVQGAYTPFECLETWGYVPFAITMRWQNRRRCS